MFLMQAQEASAGIWGVLLPFVVMFAVFYFFLLRPQQAQQKRRREMLQKLERGDKIVTVGGIHAEIVAMRDDVLTIRIADNVDVKISRSGVGQKRTTGSEEQ